MGNNKLFTLLIFSVLIVTSCKAQTNLTQKNTTMTSNELIKQLMPFYDSLMRHDPTGNVEVVEELLFENKMNTNFFQEIVAEITLLRTEKDNETNTLMEHFMALKVEVEESLYENKINKMLIQKIVIKITLLNTEKDNEANGNLIKQLMVLKEIKETEIISNNKRLLHIQEENAQNKNNP